eukprot:scaffold87956_cov72-Cyclotella_meneghiniana.AAC.1
MRISWICPQKLVKNVGPPESRRSSKSADLSGFEPGCSLYPIPPITPPNLSTSHITYHLSPGLPVVIQSPVASRKVTSFCACAWRCGQAGVGHVVRLAGACQSVASLPWRLTDDYCLLKCHYRYCHHSCALKK